MKIKLTKLLFTGEFYFEIINNDDVYFTSKDISKVFNLDIDVYNSILANKVIQHKYYWGCSNGNKNIDMTFFLNSETEETYIERFKETFADQLTLLTLESN